MLCTPVSGMRQESGFDTMSLFQTRKCPHQIIFIALNAN
ncbi:hypothetical protein ASZ90_017064 [hydrocarbon metagenome]|uniref:Uncharacterized protein n=1 Tax=hydrocarbon metagenome TaxID=938273 RepID=A0A0W8EAR7_9ZZZZ